MSSEQRQGPSDAVQRSLDAAQRAEVLIGEKTAESDRKAFLLIEPFALEGLAPALTVLGWMREVGRGCGQDTHLAEQLYRAAADQEYPSAQFALGMMYLRCGDRALARSELARAAKQSYAPAYFQLAMEEIRSHGENDRAIAVLEEGRRNGHLRCALWLAGSKFRRSRGLLQKGMALLGMLRVFLPFFWLRVTNKNDLRVL